ncbi:MAG: class II fructose-bisphosphate aldolase [Spirochaetaceae bacterium]|nr:class II fructose-bisphosphate aldolase [Spirochaetaceae bacterium]
MSFVPMKALMDKAWRGGYAVPAFCAWNAEVMSAALRVAERLRAPVILMQGPGEFPLLPPPEMAAVARAIEALHGATAALHLDHGDSPALVSSCLENGYTSVMLDYSTRPFEDNVAALAEVARLARPLGVTVEGELGHVGKASETSVEGSTVSTLTDPATAREYVERTGVDCLAVSIGNKHGFYRGDPKLEFGLLEELRAATGIPMVLHGGTGISAADIERAISFGIAKVNVASELVHGVRASLVEQWAGGRNQWTPEAQAVATRSIEASMEKWFRMTGAVERA